jgi:hypothetical protein
MEVRNAIQQIVLEHRRRYGYRRVTVELHRRGMVVNHKRVLLSPNDNRCSANGKLSNLNLSHSRGSPHATVNPICAKLPLTPSFHSQKTSRHFVGNFPLPAHNEA